MNISAAVSRDLGIGYKNELLFHISADLKRFKELTMGKVIVMGHNTFKSLPNQKPLPGRKNIVLSRNPELVIPGVFIANTKEQAMEMVSGQDTFIIGGEEVYNLFLNDCTRVYLTKVNSSPKADRFFPDLKKKPNWKLETKSKIHHADRHEFYYCEYINLNIADNR